MDYLLFLLICVVATFSPGPAVFLTIKNSATYGVKKAVWGIGGNVAAMVTMASLSAAGLGVVIMASESLYHLIKVLGGIYLLYIGIKTWCTKKRVTGVQSHSNSNVNRYKLFAEAYLVGVTNPKAIVFYTALFPQFIVFEHSVVQQFVSLTLTFALFSFVALLTYALVTDKLRVFLMKEKVSNVFNRVTGGVLVGFGLSLMASNKT